MKISTSFFIILNFLIGALVLPSKLIAKAPTLSEIKAAIKAGGLNWQAGPTSVSSLSEEEFKKLLGAVPPKNALPIPNVKSGPVVGLPASIDWRVLNGVSSVKNQQPCGSCWSFALAGLLESMIMINFGFEVDLSEQQLISCNDDGFTCNSGGNFYGADIFIDPGSILESQMPYGNTASQVDSIPCTQNNYDATAKIGSWQNLTTYTPNSDLIKNALQNGPVYTHMDVYLDFNSYENGTYIHASGGYLGGHAVVIVGYDDTVSHALGQGVYFVKNSWHESWGDNGFFTIPYDHCNIGSFATVFNSYSLPFNHTPQITQGPDALKNELMNGEQTEISATAVDPDWYDTELTYEWTVEDDCGTLEGEGNTVTFSTDDIEDSAECEVTLTVTDLGGARDSKAIIIIINPNQPPIIEIAASPVKGRVPHYITFEVIANDPEDDQNLTYEWNFGDGESAVDPVVDHVYTEPAEYIASIKVTDSYGKSSTAEIKIESYEAAQSDVNSLYYVQGGCGIVKNSQNLFGIIFLLLALLSITLTTKNSIIDI